MLSEKKIRGHDTLNKRHPINSQLNYIKQYEHNNRPVHLWLNVDSQ